MLRELLCFALGAGSVAVVMYLTRGRAEVSAKPSQRPTGPIQMRRDSGKKKPKANDDARAWAVENNVVD